MFYGDANWKTALQLLGIPFKERSTGVLVILCPFHKERTPSLHCWPKSGNYRCHGCHKTGSIEEFVQEHGMEIDRLWRAPLNDPNQLKMDFA